MRGLYVFLSVAVVNFIVLVSTGWAGLLLVDLSLVITLLIVIYENQLKLLHGRGPEPDPRERETLLRQAEQSKEEFDESDLPSSKDIIELAAQDDDVERHDK